MRSEFLIFAVLASFGTQAMSRPEVARAYSTNTAALALEEAIAEFKADVGRCPAPSEGLEILVTPTPEIGATGRYRPGGYLRTVPMDPWGRPYQFRCPGIHNPTSADVWSLGVDGEQDGVGINADIGNWPGGLDQVQDSFRFRDTLHGAALAAAAGTAVGLPVYIVGVILSARKRGRVRSAFHGFHLGVLIYLATLLPVMVVLMSYWE